MAIVGGQDLWVVGARVYINLTDAADDALIDIGVIRQANPSIAPEVVQCIDSDGGVKQTIDEGITGIDETYEVQTNNLNLDNLRLLFMADTIDTVALSRFVWNAQHTLKNGRHAKTKDLSGRWTFGLTAVGGIYSGSVTAHVVTDVRLSPNEIDVVGDQTAIYTVGVLFILSGVGLTNDLNCRTYTVVSSSFTTFTTITVTETPAAAETGITGATVVASGGTVYIQGTDWTVHSLERGIVQIPTASAITDGAYTINYIEGALSGAREVKPQTLTGVERAKVMIVYSRDNSAFQTVRECDCSISPGATNLTIEDYSDMTLTFRVLADPTADVPAGRLIQVEGALASTSFAELALD